MYDVMFRKWQELLFSFVVEPTLIRRSFAEVCEQYGNSGRFYHTLHHVQHVLETVDELGSMAHDLNAVRLAAWLHDVIYDSRASDNEELSADYAERLCHALQISNGRIVASLILATKCHDAQDSIDAKILLDADLAILGASATDYREYSRNIRREFAWVPDDEYRTARSKVLTAFLSRPTIFHYLVHLDGPARANIRAEIAELTSRQKLASQF